MYFFPNIECDYIIQDPKIGIRLALLWGSFTGTENWHLCPQIKIIYTFYITMEDQLAILYILNKGHIITYLEIGQGADP